MAVMVRPTLEPGDGDESEDSRLATIAENGYGQGVYLAIALAQLLSRNSLLFSATGAGRQHAVSCCATFFTAGEKRSVCISLAGGGNND